MSEHEHHMGAALLKWRSRQKKGAIMKPSTFERIKRSASQRGARNPEKVAGKSYWQATRVKYLKRGE